MICRNPLLGHLMHLETILGYCPYLIDDDVRVEALVGEGAGQQVPGGHSQGEHVAVAAPHLPSQHLRGLVAHRPQHLKEGRLSGRRHTHTHDLLHCTPPLRRLTLSSTWFNTDRW